MAHNALALPPHMMPWRLAGVDYLLATHDLPPELSLCSDVPHVSVPVPKARVHTLHKARPTSLPLKRAPETPINTVSPSPFSIVRAQTLPLQQWPVSWQERFHATRPAHVLWTYWTLGEDLCGTPTPARRDMLRRLLADLAHPGGTHSFWPVALPDTDRLSAHEQAFWAGVTLLKARALVVMGSAAAKAMDLPPRLRPFQQTRHKGCLIVMLQDMDILAEEAHQYEAVRAFLRQALAPYAARP